MKKLFGIIAVSLVLLWAVAGLAATGDPVLEPITIDQIDATDKSGADGTLVTGTAGTDTYAAVWNSDGDIVDGPGVPAITDLSNIASTAIPVSLISDTAGMDDLGTAALFWQTLYLQSTIQFEGDTDDSYYTQFSVTDPTGTRTITIPDSDETIGVASSVAAGAIDAIGEIDASLRTGSDTTLVTGTAGSSGNVAQWNADGDIVDGGAIAPGSFGSASDVTISTGVIDASGGANFLEVAGEGAAADDLTEIQAAAAGDIVVLQRDQGAAYTVTVKDGTYMQLQADFALDHDDDTIVLICETAGANDTFKELSRANNG